MTSLPFSTESGIFLDIETVPGGELFGLGVIHGSSFRREAFGQAAVSGLVREVRQRTSSARYIAGHNIISHDLPILDSVLAIPEFRQLPAIDTLYLSPLAFPRNPYHRLAKDDHLVRSSKNHPARDCESSRTILGDAVVAFGSVLQEPRSCDRLALTRWLLARAELPWNGSAGFDMLFFQLGVPDLAPERADAVWTSQTDGLVCPAAATEEWTRAQTTPAHRAALAYVLAWLPVAGSDSVLPGWVRHRFPQTATAIRHLRGTPCRNPDCPWCGKTMSPTGQLKRFFGYDSFRPEPPLAGVPGVSLQEEIVRQAMAGTPVLGILPTGGGKSLCFQVPALHRYFTMGSLTIVLTPLQALMKDQVDGLIEKTSTSCVAALNSMQTLPERAEVREAVRLGSIGILYVSPEQVRNSSFKRTIIQREIGCWVFDEAHCLSQWGHDFRPDYVYVARFIRELAAEQHVPVPPVMCVTATAKDEVKDEIIRHFQQKVGHSLMLLDGGTSRQNLSYRIEKVSEHEKPARLHELLSERIGDGLGAAVVFAATRKRVQDFATLLASPPRGWSCAAFHAGLSAEEKKGILDDFLARRLQVIVATNAFGMGIDKPDIRLVVHVDTPGSLESYLQEAGRAGRDQEPADCVLLYNPEDLETQFGLMALARIEKRDIDQIWRAILRADRGDGQPVTLTVTEILEDPHEPAGLIDESEDQRGSKVRTALAVLEKQGFLERNENYTRVFQARPLVTDEEEARARIARLDLSENKRCLWLDVMSLLLAQDSEQQASLEEIAELPRMKALYSQMRGSTYERVSPYAPVFQVLNEMAKPEAGLLSKDVHYSTRLRVGRKANAGRMLAAISARERELLELLRDEEPDPEGWTPLAVRRVNQHLISKGHASLPDDVIRVLKTLSTDGRKMGRPAALLELGYTGRNHTPVRVSGSWSEILKMSSLRNDAAAVLVQHLMGKAKTRPDIEMTETLVEFTEAEVLETFHGDAVLDLSAIRDLPAFLQYILVHLHDNAIIELKNGKALIAQSMSLRVLENTKGRQRRRFTRGDYAALLFHYSEKIFQIHVMGEYARQGVERLGMHLRLIKAYFEMGKAGFAARFLRENAEVYQRATGLDSFRKIVDELCNPVQQAIVAEASDANMLVLAGPGSGKTRVVAHRCAYLLRVERIRASRILVACFNRHASLQLRRSIFRLVGKDAYGVMIQTYHGLALRLLGRSLAGAVDSVQLPDFNRILEEATELLSGKPVADTFRAEDMRDRILAGFSHILVDEYQDVDEREYAFISALAGRKEAEEERKLAIVVVGDDDQSIYGFKGANVRFIQRFQNEYNAREHYLTENYRSTRAIIAATNRLIAKNTNRMKIAHAIRVNGARDDTPAGGRWEALDPLVRGNVQQVMVADASAQAGFAAMEIQRLHDLDPKSGYSAFAVIGRTRDVLVGIRAALDDAGMLVDWRGDDEMPVSLFRIREIHDWLAHLEAAKYESWTAPAVRIQLTGKRGNAAPNRWWRFLDEIHSEWAGESGEAEVPVSLIRDFFVEAIAERRRHQRTGYGVILVTAHKAKGLEFPHVMIVDGGWCPTADKVQMEEERRVYYVAATRAKETLTVMVRRDHRTPFPNELAGPHVIDRTPRSLESITASDVSTRRYGIVDPTELFLSFPAGMPESSPVHAALRATSVGDPVQFMSRGKWIHLETPGGVPIAALSEAGRAKWGPRLGAIRSATVTAMVRRTADQDGEAYRARAKVAAWEFPVVEACWTA